LNALQNTEYFVVHVDRLTLRCRKGMSNQEFPGSADASGCPKRVLCGAPNMLDESVAFSEPGTVWSEWAFNLAPSGGINVKLGLVGSGRTQIGKTKRTVRH
jgi:hypothetical protein